MKRHLNLLAAACVVAFVAARPARALEIAFETDHSLPLVYVNVALKVGSIADPKDGLGLTNFMAEMMLRGTAAHTKAEIDHALDQMGGRLEAETRAEAVTFRGAVLKEQLRPFLTLLREIVTTPNFPEAEIRKLQAETVSAILEEEGRDPSLAGRKFNEFLFRGHPYGQPVIGTAKDIGSLTAAQVRAQYDRVVRDRYLLVVGSGDADEGDVRTWAGALAQARPDIAGAPDFLKLAAPTDDGRRRLEIVDKPERTQTQINLGQIGVRMTDTRFFPLYLGNHAFGGGSFVARMMTEIRMKRGWSYGAGSYFRHGTQPRSWIAHLFPASKDAAPALAYTLQMIQDLHEHGITQAEFAFAQRSLVNSAGFMYDTPQKRVENKLLERTLDLPDGFMKSYGPALARVKLGDVNDALKSYLRPDRLAISVLATAKDSQAALAKAAGVAADQVTVVPYNQE